MLFVRRYEVLAEPRQVDAGVPLGEVMLRAATGNTGVVYLGGSSLECTMPTLRYTLSPLIPEKIKISNLSCLWYFGSATGDLFGVIAEVG